MISPKGMEEFNRLSEIEYLNPDRERWQTRALDLSAGDLQRIVTDALQEALSKLMRRSILHNPNPQASWSSVELTKTNYRSFCTSETFTTLAFALGVGKDKAIQLLRDDISAGNRIFNPLHYFLSKSGKGTMKLRFIYPKMQDDFADYLERTNPNEDKRTPRVNQLINHCRSHAGFDGSILTELIDPVRAGEDIDPLVMRPTL